MRSPSRNVVGRNTRTPLRSSWVTLDGGASSDDMTHVGTSRAVLTSCTPRLSIARRSNPTRTGGRRGVTGPRTVSWGLSWRAVVPPTAIASNPARNQCTCSRAASPETHCELPAASAIRPSIDVASLSATKGRSSCSRANRNGAFNAAPASASRTAPTRGLGATRPQPRRARSRARSMAARSAGGGAARAVDRSESEPDADTSEDMCRLGIEAGELRDVALVLAGLQAELPHELHGSQAESAVHENQGTCIGRVDHHGAHARERGAVMEPDVRILRFIADDPDASRQVHEHELPTRHVAIAVCVEIHGELEPIPRT